MPSSQTSLKVAFGGIGVLALVGALLAAHAFESIDSTVRRLVDRTQPIVVASYEMEINAHEIALKVFAYRDSRDEGLLLEIERDRDQFEASLQSYSALGHTAEHRRLARELRAAFDGLCTAADRVTFNVDGWAKTTQRVDAQLAASAGAGALATPASVKFDEQRSALLKLVKSIASTNGGEPSKTAQFTDLRQIVGELQSQLGHLPARARVLLRRDLRVLTVATDASATPSTPAETLNLRDLVSRRQNIDDLLDDHMQQLSLREAAAAHQSLQTATREAVAAVALYLLLLLSLAWHGYFRSVRLLLHPIQRLADAMGDLSSGNRLPRLDPTGSRDMRWLALRFNEMASEIDRTLVSKAALERSEAQLTERNRELHALIEQQRRTQAELVRVATHDYLTGLPNRAAAFAWVEDRIAPSHSAGAFGGALFIDLDGFKAINDAYGHGIGDQLLVEVAARMRRVLAPEDLLSRLGGDEFLALIVGVTTPASLEAIANALRDALASPVTMGALSVRCSASIGIVPATEVEGANVESLIRDADIAMYEAKQKGVGSVVLFNKDMSERAQNAINLESQLRCAIDNDELEIHYQPIHSLSDGRLHGFEALIRWQHPTRGMLLPKDFLQIAGRAGIMPGIDRWVLLRVCSTMRSWSLRAGRPAAFSMNISAQDVKPSLVGSVRDALKTSGLHPSQLSLELTEGALLADSEQGIEVLRALRDHGVGILIDDFGTGYSSLSYLHLLPITGLKVDRSFVEGLFIRAECEHIIRAIVLLAQHLNLKIVVEGVESKRQFEFLQNLGCDFVQGFYVSTALPEPEAEQYFASRFFDVEERSSRYF